MKPLLEMATIIVFSQCKLDGDEYIADCLAMQPLERTELRQKLGGREEEIRSVADVITHPKTSLTHLATIVSH